VWRHAYKVITIVLSTFCLAVVFFWIRSYWQVDRIALVADASADAPEFGRFKGQLFSWRGRAHLAWVEHQKSQNLGWRYELDTCPARGRRGEEEVSQWDEIEGALGFGCLFDRHFYRSSYGTWVRERVIIVPYWFLVLLFGLAPAIHIVRTGFRTGRRARWRGQGRCLSCGYDLRASAERCPECGAPVPADIVRLR